MYFDKFLTRVLTLLLVLVAFSFPAAATAEEKGGLLREIEEYIREYYLYAVEDELFPLASVEDLPRVFKDPYSAYLREEQFNLFTDSLGRTLFGVGIYLEVKDCHISVVSTIPGSPAHKGGIKSDDLILSVDGRPVRGASLEEVVALIRGEEGTTVSLAIQRGDKVIVFNLVREKIRLPAVEFAREGSDIALLRLYNFDLGAADEVKKVLEEIEKDGLGGIILDLRANQGGYLHEALEIASFFAEGALLRVRGSSSAWEEIASPTENSKEYPMVVLINRGAASAAEILAAALKDSGSAILVGEISFGKGTMQTLFPLEHGGYLKLTTSEFASPSGIIIEGNGVEPHFLVSNREEQALLAAELLRHLLKGPEGSFSFVEGALRNQGRAAYPVIVDGEAYYPLRATLLLTGRTIYAHPSAGIYQFSLNNRKYLLDIHRMEITWRDGEEVFSATRVILERGVTYVPRKFLENALGLP